MTDRAKNDRVIYHICKAGEWHTAEAAGYYLGSTRDRRDGFIHLSTAAQLTQTANRHFTGQTGLVALAVDTARLGTDLVWEPSAEGELFPHLYTRMPASAVIGVKPIETAASGSLVLPLATAEGFATDGD